MATKSITQDTNLDNLPPHLQAAIAGETCPICGHWVGQVDDPVAELLDAADAVVTAISECSWSQLWPAAHLLRQVVTRMQGTAGLSVTAGGEA